nr:beta-glucosidase [Pseudomonas sp.]
MTASSPGAVPLFDSYFLGGFECSTHRRRDGRRLDLLAATRHDVLARQDYLALQAHDIATVRDGVRWHLVETAAGHYDWSSFLPMLQAARDTGTQVIWDLCHYGWPDGIDIWTPAFVERFARFAGAVARLVRDETEGIPVYCPVNEISFWAWAGGDMKLFNPGTTRRGMELKTQLVRAALAATHAIRAEDPRARIVLVDPVINVVPKSPRTRRQAAHAQQAQFEAWDMIAGRLHGELGGDADCLDIIGVNYYSNNQWVLRGPTIRHGDPRYKPFREILSETWQRYGRPLFVAETGAEGAHRAPWLRYVCNEVFAALQAGVPVGGICLYPVTDYPGWANGRHCRTGLLGVSGTQGHREVDTEFAIELAAQQDRFRTLLAPLSSEGLRATG